MLPEVKAAMLTLGPLSEQSPPLLVARAHNSSTTSDDGDSNCEACIGVVPVLLIIITELLVAAALLWLWVEKGHVLTRRYGCGWIARRGRFWCGAGRRRRGQNAPSCSGTARDGPRSSKVRIGITHLQLKAPASGWSAPSNHLSRVRCPRFQRPTTDPKAI